MNIQDTIKELREILKLIKESTNKDSVDVYCDALSRLMINSPKHISDLLDYIEALEKENNELIKEIDPLIFKVSQMDAEMQIRTPKHNHKCPHCGNFTSCADGFEQHHWEKKEDK